MTIAFGHSLPRLSRWRIVPASRPAPSVVIVPLPNLLRRAHSGHSKRLERDAGSATYSSTMSRLRAVQLRSA
jgi:hypothetical protein